MASVYFDDLELGHTFTSSRRTVTEADITSFSAITGDYSPLHADDVFVSESTDFDGRIAQGWLIVAIQSGLHSEIEGWRILAYVGMDRSFIAAVYPGDTIHAKYTVSGLRRSSSKPDRGVVTVDCQVLNQRSEVVCRGDEIFMLLVRQDATE